LDSKSTLEFKALALDSKSTLEFKALALEISVGIGMGADKMKRIHEKY